MPKSSTIEEQENIMTFSVQQHPIKWPKKNPRSVTSVYCEVHHLLLKNSINNKHDTIS